MVTKNQNICLLSATDHIANYLFQITIVNERVMSEIPTPFYQQLQEYQQDVPNVGAFYAFCAEFDSIFF